MARQPRTGDDGVSAVMPGEKVRLSWSPAAALLLGPADEDRPPASATPEPLELPA
jgi:hypothetical protein